MAIAKFSSNRWGRDATYRANYIEDLVEHLADELGALGWSVAPMPSWQGEIERTAEARLEQFVNDDQIRLRVDAKAKTLRVSHLDASREEVTWSFETGIGTPAAEIAQTIRER